MMNRFGYVPYDHLIGRIAMVFYSADGSTIRTERIGLRVH
jgi:hypothetical protein